MTTVDWAVICDLAYFDTFGRLYLFGIDTSGAVRRRGGLCVESRGEYVIVHIPSFPLQEEGIYRFELTCGVKEPAICEMNVLVQPRRLARIHCHGAY